MNDPASSFQIVLCTAGSETQAAEIARLLVQQRLAACVNIVRSVCSVYRWEGEVVEDGEALLIIKTRRSHFEAVRRTIREQHSYATPEIVAFDLSDADPEYLAWFAECIPTG